MSIFQSNWRRNPDDRRSEEHTSELQSHLNSYAVFCLRSEEHTSELQSHLNLVCRLLLEKKKIVELTVPGDRGGLTITSVLHKNARTQWTLLLAFLCLNV